VCSMLKTAAGVIVVLERLLLNDLIFSINTFQDIKSIKIASIEFLWSGLVKCVVGLGIDI